MLDIIRSSENNHEIVIYITGLYYCDHSSSSSLNPRTSQNLDQIKSMYTKKFNNNM